MNKTVVQSSLLGIILLLGMLGGIYTFVETFLALPRRVFLISLLALGFFFGFIYRYLIKTPYTQTKTKNKNITSQGRRTRGFSGAVLLIVAISTSWSPYLIFFAGFCFFEAVFSWCGLYGALGKNSCPVEVR